MVIFQRALLRELSGYAVAVFAALFVIVVTSQLVRLLGRAAGGKIPSDAIVMLVGFTSMNYLPVLLGLSLFVSVLMTVSRCYRDSEMVIWTSSGLSLTAWIRPVVMFAVPLVLLIGVLALFLAPWANDRAEEFRERLQSRDEVSQVAPGVFREASGAKRVFFVESIDEAAGRVRNIFVSSEQHGREGIIVSREGLLETAPSGDRYAVLLNGRRYEGTPGSAEYRITEFGRYAVRIETKERATASSSPRAASTLDLIRSSDPRARAELVWRLGLPLAALNLALLAVPLAFANPRATRSFSFVFAILAYLTYANLLNVMQSLVGQGKVAFEIGLWALHAAMFALVVLLFAWRTTAGFRFLALR